MILFIIVARWERLCWMKIKKVCLRTSCKEFIHKKNRFLLEDLCNSFDRLCSQICENTDDSYVCKCNPGYELLEDRISCVPKGNELTNNEVYSNSTEWVVYIYLSKLLFSKYFFKVTVTLVTLKMINPANVKTSMNAKAEMLRVI